MLFPGRGRHLSGGLAAWVAAVLLGHAVVLAWVQALGETAMLPPRLSVHLLRPAELVPAAPPRPVPPQRSLRSGAPMTPELASLVPERSEPPPAVDPLPPLPPLVLPDPVAFEPGPEWPLSTRLVYRVEGHYRGPVHGDAVVEWLRQGARYQLRLQLGIGPRLTPFALRELSSEGRVSEDGLRPERYDERTRIGFAAPRHTVLRLAEGRVRWPNGAERPAPEGVQDSASQFGQLAWLLQSGRAALQPGQVLELPLALPQGVSPWRYEVVGRELAPTPLGEATELWHLRPLLPLPPGSLAAEVWLAPALSYLPLRLRIRQGSEVWLWLHLDAVPLQEQAPAPQNAASLPAPTSP